MTRVRGLTGALCKFLGLRRPVLCVYFQALGSVGQQRRNLLVKINLSCCTESFLCSVIRTLKISGLRNLDFLHQSPFERFMVMILTSMNDSHNTLNSSSNILKPKF